MRLSSLILMVCILFGCAQVTTRKTIDESTISENARTKINEARNMLKENNSKGALQKLAELEDEKLSEIEKSLKYNLKGVILFGLGEIEKSILNFEVAEKYTPKDTQLYSQIQLNMASGHFKLNQLPELKTCLSKIDVKSLNENEEKKYAQLSLVYGKKFENHLQVVNSSLLLLKGLKSFADVQSSNFFDGLKESFDKLSEGQKISILEEHDGSGNIAAAYLAYQLAEARYVSGDKDGASDVISWLKAEYKGTPDVDKILNEFELRMENLRRISLNDIGVVLPLTGEKAAFGQKALSGLDVGLQILGLNESVIIHTKDSLDSPPQGAQEVLNLIREKKVSMIVGGLFPETAKSEYLEARKYGVLYISLSQINLPKEEKNHNLIEIQGSIESQVETLLSDQMIGKFGTKLGVIYPDNDGGKSYVDEIWRKAQQKNVQLTSIAGFQKNNHDFRDSAQLFLGLKYDRERSEELKILQDVYAFEKNSIRRVQTLPPVIDFDWVFLATYPHEATSLIPTLGYYDANNIKAVGGPSWVANSMVKEQKNIGTLYFVGDDPKDINQDILNKFKEIYNKPAGLLEIIALDAMKVCADILNVVQDVRNRDDFDSKVKSSSLKGIATSWSFRDGVWLKKMNPMTITRGEIVKMSH